MTNNNTALATIGHATDLVPQTMEDMVKLAARAAASKFFVGAVTPEAALIIALTGNDLGLSPMQALRGLHIIEGKPTLSADVMVAICLRSPLCEYFRTVSTSAEECTVETKRTGQEPQRMSFTMDEAKLAGLAGRGNWSKYPAAMLRARAKSALARDAYADLLFGVYDTDELDPSSKREQPATQHIAPVVRHVPASRPSPTHEASFEAPQLPAAEDERSETMRFMDEIDACHTQEEYNRIGSASRDAVKHQRITKEEGRAIGDALASLREARGFLTIKEQEAAAKRQAETPSPEAPAVEAAQ